MKNQNEDCECGISNLELRDSCVSLLSINGVLGAVETPHLIVEAASVAKGESYFTNSKLRAKLKAHCLSILVIGHSGSCRERTNITPTPTYNLKLYAFSLATSCSHIVITMFLIETEEQEDRHE